MAQLMVHMTSDFRTRPDDDGWFRGHCECDWEGGPYPDAETLVDALMAHAYDAALATPASPAPLERTDHFATADADFIRQNPDWQGEPSIAAGHTYEACKACATPASPAPLDVERLTEALYVVDRQMAAADEEAAELVDPSVEPARREYARALAHEYDRLAQP
jgi:hypothetical protein